MVNAFTILSWAVLEHYLSTNKPHGGKDLPLLFAKQISRNATLKVVLFGNIHCYGNLSPQSEKGNSEISYGLSR